VSGTRPAELLRGEPLASSVSDFRDTASLAITAQTQEDAFDNVNYLERLAHEINSRVGVVLDDVL
jgi:hypothetical protein